MVTIANRLLKTRKKLQRLAWRRVRKTLRKFLYLDGRLVAGAGILTAAAILTISVMAYRSYMTDNLNPTAYKPLLNVIAKGESQGNYNAYFGNPSNDSIQFTNMSVAEVLKWQESYVERGSPSSAVGKYQIIRPTLASLVQKFSINPDTKFSATLQDKLAVALLQKRGARQFMAKKLTREQFAANLAKEWAALPKVTGANPTQSYYAGDGINAAHISIDEIYTALDALHT